MIINAMSDADFSSFIGDVLEFEIVLMAKM